MTNINPAQLIKKAILSEKTYKQMENGLYTFLVDNRSTKSQIAKAVENQFQVNIVRVNVLKKAGKTKRITGTRKITRTAGSKKAIVYLKSGQSIEMLAPKTKNVSKSQSIKATKSQPDKELKESKTGAGLLSKITRSKKEEEKF